MKLELQVGLFGALLLLGVAPTAQAADDTTKVDVIADVVLASNQGNSVEPPSLMRMKDEFAKKNLRFTSFKLVSTQKIALTKAQPAELSLPNAAVAKLRLQELKDGKATIAVELRKVESKIQLGKEGSVFVHGGKHENGELVVVLQPASMAGK